MLQSNCFLLSLLWTMNGAVGAGGQPPAPRADEPYVKFRLPVEIRGVLRHSEKGTFIETKEESRQGVKPSFGGNAVPAGGQDRKEVQTRWELDLGAMKLAPKALAELSGTTVVVKGASELRPVSLLLFVPQGGLVRFMTLEPQRKVTVSELKAVNGK